MGRGEPTQRVLSVLLALERAPQGRRAAELATQLDLSIRTVQRALRTLEDTGFPLMQEADGRESRWRLMPSKSVTVPFSTGEALALVWAEQAQAPGLQDTILGQPLESAVRKVRAALPPDVADQVLARSGHRLSPHRPAPRVPPPRPLEFPRRPAARHPPAHHRPDSLPQPRPEAPAPPPGSLYLFAHHLGAVYVVGFCHRRRAVRTFLADRITSVVPSQETFAVDPDFSADRYFEGVFGIYRGSGRGKPTEVRLRFDRDAADWATERIWHRSQRVRSLLDGSVEITLRVAPTPDLMGSILSFGRHVEVLSPVALARAVAREWFAAAAKTRKASGCQGCGCTDEADAGGANWGRTATKTRSHRRNGGA